MKNKKQNIAQAKKKIGKNTAMKKTQNKLSIKELLLNGPKFDFKLPKRRKWRSRTPVEFD